MTLYLKYRPQKLKDLDLVSVRETLEKIIKSGDIPHAFLFAGPKGTGKTSAARIIAKILNCEKNEKKLKEPCDKCYQCKSIIKGTNIDVIELDAASYRGIDDVRAIKEAAKLVPIRARKKVYIIDEAHMLTTEASNALLKILEEPPSHVVFILATTNPEKLIGTIRSRTTIINFTKATNEELVESLLKKVRGEKVKYERGALEVIAKISDGSFRDATKILEELIQNKILLHTDKVEKYLSRKGFFNVEEFMGNLIKKDEERLLLDIQKMVERNVRIEDFINNLMELLRKSILVNMGIIKDSTPQISIEDSIYLIGLFMNAKKNLPFAYIEALPLEIAVIRWCENKGESGGDENEKEDFKEDENEEEVVFEEKKDLMPKKNKKVNNKKHSFTNKKIGKEKPISDEVWSRILEEVRPINMSIEALLRAAKPIGFDGKMLKLGVYYRFHKEKLEEIKNRGILESIAGKVLASPVRIVYILTESPDKNRVRNKEDLVPFKEDKDDVVKMAKEIFGN